MLRLLQRWVLVAIAAISLSICPAFAYATSLTLTGFGGGGAAAPTPVVQTVATTGESAANTTHAITYPTGIASGEMLLMITSVFNSSFSGAPSGWSTALPSTSFNNDNVAVYYKYPTAGSESGTFSISTAASRKVAAIVYRISGAIAVEAGTLATSTSTSITPPSLTVSWGAANNLFVIGYSVQTSSFTPTFPSGYSNPQNVNTSSGSAVVTASAQKASVSGTETPGSMTSSNGNDAQAVTIGLQP